METIGNLGIASEPEASQSIEIVPLGINFKFLHNWLNLSSIAAMRLLPIALTLGLVSVATHALAVQKIGDNGNDVINTQRCLKKLGYFNAPLTGKFASLTQKAVIGFQRANRLAADGVVGTNTERSLRQACLGRNPGGNVSISGGNVSISGGNVSISGGNIASGNLRQGSSGSNVSKLQQDLRQLGYFYGRVNGYFGLDTQQAVMRFQQKAGLRPDGIVGSRTKQQIFISLGEGGEYPVLSENSSGPSVTRLQQLLRQAGYFNANPTGRFGIVTKNSVIAFQRNYNLPANGVANRQTWDALLRIAQNPTPNPSPSPGGVSLSPEQVRQLQERLRDLGYFNANPTGYVGPLTLEAVRRFQQDYRLNPDGIADTQVLEAVRRAWDQRNASQPGKNYISVGDRGDNVRTLQERLRDLGYFNANPDGFFSEYTRSSVIAFQQYSGINPSGVVDTQTWQVLRLNGSPVANRRNTNRYVVIVPISNNDTLIRVRQYVADAFLSESRLGNYVNAGAFSDRAQAEQRSQELRSRGLDARVDYF